MPRVTKIPQALRSRESPWITAKEAADYLGVGVDAIYDACATKGLRNLRIGRSTLRLKREWVDEWAERRASNSDGL